MNNAHPGPAKQRFDDDRFAEVLAFAKPFALIGHLQQVGWNLVLDCFTHRYRSLFVSIRMICQIAVSANMLSPGMHECCFQSYAAVFWDSSSSGSAGASSCSSSDMPAADDGSPRLLLSLMFRRSSFAESALRIASS